MNQIINLFNINISCRNKRAENNCCGPKLTTISIKTNSDKQHRMPSITSN